MAIGQSSKLPRIYPAHMLHQNATFLFAVAQSKINHQELHAKASAVKIKVFKKQRASLAPRRTSEVLSFRAFSIFSGSLVHVNPRITHVLQ